MQTSPGPEYSSASWPALLEGVVLSPPKTELYLYTIPGSESNEVRGPAWLAGVALRSRWTSWRTSELSESRPAPWIASVVWCPPGLVRALQCCRGDRAVLVASGT